MDNIIELIVIVSCVVAMGIMLADKWGILDWYENKSVVTKYLPSPCLVCLSFWLSIIIVPIVICMSHIEYDSIMILVPLITPPIIYKLVT